MTSPPPQRTAAARLREALSSTPAAAAEPSPPAQEAATVVDIAEARLRASAAQRELLRAQVATSAGLPLEVARFLYGEDREELEQAAEAFKAFALELAGIQPPQPPAPPDLKQGRVGGIASDPDTGSSAAVDAAIRGERGHSRHRIF